MGVKMICKAAIRVTCMKDFVSVVKILLKAFFICLLFPYPPHNPRSIRFIVQRFPPLLPATSETPHV
jgi:hypothetical protein